MEEVSVLEGCDAMMTEAFNAGCQARLNGDSVLTCPYEGNMLRKSWVNGWRDVHNNWGRGARGLVSALPQIRK